MWKRIKIDQFCSDFISIKNEFYHMMEIEAWSKSTRDNRVLNNTFVNSKILGSLDRSLLDEVIISLSKYENNRVELDLKPSLIIKAIINKIGVIQNRDEIENDSIVHCKHCKYTLHGSPICPNQKHMPEPSITAD